nr:choice-of-anchor Q domain-containing protein [uncultured Dethiosulfovibrio sp.]
MLVGLKKIFTRSICVSVAILTLGFQSADGAIFRVNGGNTAGGDGLSWSGALNEPQFGIKVTEAQSGDVFFVAKGIYRPSVPSEALSADKALSFAIPEGVALYGGFAGTEESLEERNHRQNITILTGDLYFDDISDDRGVTVSADAIAGTNSIAVVTTKSVQSAILDGFVITGGDGRNGGGMVNVDSNVKVSNCTFWGNRAAGMGGAMVNQKGAPEIGDSLFVWNRGGGRTNGGAIANILSDPRIISCTFEDNRTGTGSSVPKECVGNGGAIYSGRGNPVLIGCVFRRNEAGAGGGAVYNQRCTPTIERCAFEDNRTYHNAGALRNESVGSDGSISQSLFRGNFTVIEGGAIYNTGTDMVISDSTFIGNVVSADIDDDDKGSGGALYNAKSSPVVINTTFVDNRSKNGGAIYNRVNSDPLFINCTVKGNFASKNGGGMYSTSCSSSTSCGIGQGSNPVVLNSIFWDNQGGEIFSYGDSAPAIYFSVIRSGDVVGDMKVVSSDIRISDPLLGDAGDNGGFVMTCSISRNGSALDGGWKVGEISSGDFVSGDVVWQAKSWANLPISVPSADQRGVSRPQGDGVDVGAFELTTFAEPIKPVPLSPDTVSGDSLAPVLKVMIPVPSGDSLKKVHWQIARDRDFKDIVFDTDLQEKENLLKGMGNNAFNSGQSETVSLQIPKDKLAYGTDYYVRVRPLFEKSGWTEWSEVSTLSTEPAPSSSGGCSVATFGPGALLLLIPAMLLSK